MVAATYTYEVDWDASGTFDGGNEDITSNVIEQAAWNLGTSRFGASRQFDRSEARLTLNNESGIYSSLLSSGALFGSLLPGRTVRIRAVDATGTVTLWTGEIESLVPVPSVEPPNTAILTAVGPLTAIGERAVQMAMSTSIATGALVDDLLDSVGWPSAYQTIVVADSPAGYWRFGESSGNAIDLSGNGNDGTVTGATQGVKGLIGDSDTAYSFDGASGDVDFGSPSELDDIFAGGGSIEAWLNANSDGEGNAGRILHKSQWHLLIFGESAGFAKLSFQQTFSGTDGQWNTTDAVIVLGQKHHIAVVYDQDAVGNNPTIFIDKIAYTVGSGLTEALTPTGSADTDAAASLLIGNRAADDRTFDGTIDEVAVYASELTAAQVVEHIQSRDIDTGQTTIDRFAAADAFENEMQLTTALSDVVKTENGLGFENRYGQVVFEDRDRRLLSPHTTSQGTFSDASTTRTYIDIAQENELLSIYNIIPIKIQLYTIGVEAVIWTFPAITAGTAPAILAGASLTVWASYPNPGSVINGFAVDAWTTPAVTTDYLFNTTAGGGGTDRSSTTSVVPTKFANSMKLVFTNDHATDTIYPLKIEVQGTPVTLDDPINLQAEDVTSQGLYRERTLTNTARWVPSVAEGIQHSNWLLVQRKDPNPPLRITVQGNRDAIHLSEVLRRTISNRITIVNANLGINGDYFIEAETHTVDPLGPFHQVTWDCSPVGAYAKSWVLNTGALNATTGLHYH